MPTSHPLITLCAVASLVFACDGDSAKKSLRDASVMDSDAATTDSGMPQGDGDGDGGQGDGDVVGDGDGDRDAGRDSGIPVGEHGPLPPALTWTQENNSPLGIQRIWGSGPNDIYVVGGSGLLSHSTGDGQWKEQTVNTGANLYGIWGSGPNDIYVATYANLVLHSTGNGTWDHQVTTSGNLFVGVSGTGPNDIYVYDGPPSHSTGDGTWTPVTISSTEAIRDMWGTSADNVYAMGNMKTVYHRTQGGNWGPQVLSTDRPLLSITGSSATDIYVGSTKKIFHSQGDGKWNAQTPPLDASNVLERVWALNRDAIYATSRGQLYRSNGNGEWVGQVLVAANPTLTIVDIWGTSTTNLYVATTAGVYHGTAP